MSEIDKIQFKAELELNLKSPEDLQKWAIDTLDSDPSNELSLEICFLLNSQQILEYFNRMPKSKLEISLRKKIVYKSLNDYALSQHMDNSIESIWNSFQKILTLAQYIEDDDLCDFVNRYNDEFHLAVNGVSRFEEDEVFPMFIKDLKMLFQF